MKHIKCNCAKRKSLESYRVTESDLHIYIGIHTANSQVNLRMFEYDLEFSSVTHWDVGFTQSARYFIYRNESNEAIAWYDTAKQCGYKN